MQSWTRSSRTAVTISIRRIRESNGSANFSFSITDEPHIALYSYRDGESETWIGEWMQQRQNRDELVIATKYTNTFHPSGPQSTYIGNNIKSMKLSLETSLKRLQTSYVDIFYVHVWDFTTSIPELMLGLNDLVRSGKVMYLGISGACMRAPYPIQRRICS